MKRPYLSYLYLLPLLYYLALGLVLWRTRGYYFTLALVIVLVTFAIAIFGTWKLMVQTDAPKKPASEKWIFSSILFIFSLFLFWNARLVFADAGLPMRLVKGTLDVILVASSLRLVLLHFKKEHAIQWLDLISLVLVFGVGILTPFASPNPAIDVFSITEQAIEFFRHGINPYSQTYVDIYNGRYGYRASPNYWPGLFYLLAPFQILFGDLRFGYIAANFATLLALYKLVPGGASGRGLGFFRRLLKRDHGTLLLWFLFPVSFFVLEQAWTDILLVAFSAWIAVTIKEKRWALCGLLAGFMFGTKQYGVVLGWITFLYILFSSSFKDAIKFLIFSAVGFLVCVLPFAVWDWRAFYDNSVKLYFEQPFRNDSLVVQNLLREMGIDVPSQVRILPVILGSFALVPLWFQKAKSLDLRHWSVALALVYGLIFLLVKNAFCNYYYFQAFFVFLFLVESRNLPESRMGSDSQARE